MINYCLNYFEDFEDECIHKKIICVGVDDTVNESKLRIISKYINAVEYWVTYRENFTNLKVCGFEYDIIQFYALKTINLENYVLLIVSDYIDYVKRLLEEIVGNVDIFVNCYTYKLNFRNYNDERVLKKRRLDDIALYWFNYYLDIFCNCPEKERLLFERKTALFQNAIRIIPRLIVVLTTKCNLACENCIALTPHYKHQYDIPLVTIIESIERIMDIIDECTCVELIGGEPFLYSELTEIIAYLKSNKKVRFIQLTTNGMVFNYSNEYRELLSGNVVIRVSDYSISDRTTEFILWLRENRIIHVVQKDPVWTKIGDIKHKNKKHQALKDEFNLCFEGMNCKTLLNGKIFDCTFASRIFDLGFADHCEYVDVLNGNITWKVLYCYWTRNESIACDYCNIMNPNAELVKSAIQLQNSRVES